jgi:hypothetical protein
MSDRNKIIVGLADLSLGNKVANVVSNVTASGTATTLGAATGAVGFFGATPTTQATSAAVTDFATLKAALQSYGLVGS